MRGKFIKSLFIFLLVAILIPVRALPSHASMDDLVNEESTNSEEAIKVKKYEALTLIEASNEKVKLKIKVNNRDRARLKNGIPKANFRLYNTNQLFNSEEKEATIKIGLFKVDSFGKTWVRNSQITINKKSKKAQFKLKLSRFTEPDQNYEIHVYDTDKNLVNKFETMVHTDDPLEESNQVASDDGREFFSEDELDYIFKKLSPISGPTGSNPSIEKDSGSYVLSIPKSSTTVSSGGGAGPAGPAGSPGPSGPAGAVGPAGSSGTNGLNCWDLNENGSKDIGTEDANGDLTVDVNDCQFGGGRAADFANGGEADGANRTLGNTDAFDFSLITNNLNRLHIKSDGKIGAGTSTPSASFHIKAGGTNPGEAPLKLSSGTNLASPEDGALEYDGAALYFTVGADRKVFSFSDGDGSNITDLNADNISSGTLDNARLNANVVLEDASQTLTNKTFTSPTINDASLSNPSVSGTLTTGAISTTGNISISGTVDGIDVSDLDASVTSNTSAITTNTTNISSNSSSIGTNTANIAAHSSSIGTNTANITTNTTNIASNTSAIAANTTAIASKADLSAAAFTGTVSAPTIGIGISNPTAGLHLKAGIADPNGAPLKLTAGVNLTTEEDGALEFDGTDLFFTAGGTRKTFSFGGEAVTGDGSALTNLNADNISSGTLTDARLSSNVVLKDASQTLTNKTISGTSNSLTDINASNISTGTLADLRLSANVPFLNANNTFTGNNYLNGSIFLGDNASDLIIANGTVAGATPLVFEGLSLDRFQTSFAITDPTADHTITFKDESGTVAFLSDIAGGGDFSDGGDTAGADRTLGNNDNYDLEFETNGSTRMHIKNNGNIGLGTTNPSFPLEIVYSLAGDSQDIPGLIIRNTSEEATLRLDPGSTGVSWAISADEGEDKFRIHEGTTDRVVIKNGNFGINASNPSAKLEVGGQVKITGGSPGSGKVLTSDGAGLATWQDLSNDGSNLTNINASNITSGTLAEARIHSSIARDTEVESVVTKMIDDKADKASPSFTGLVTIPTVKITGGTPGSGKVLSSDADGDASWQDPLESTEYAVYVDSKSAGSGGGACTANTWLTRTINTTQASAGSSISRSGNVITLEAGTYYIDASAPAYRVRSHAVKFRNTSDSTDALIGSAEYAHENYQVQSRSNIKGYLTVASTKNFEIQHICDRSTGSRDFGIDNNFGSFFNGADNIFTQIYIKKVSN